MGWVYSLTLLKTNVVLSADYNSIRRFNRQPLNDTYMMFNTLLYLRAGDTEQGDGEQE